MHNKQLKMVMVVGTLCEGWNWIRENLKALDHVFQLKEYKAQNGMKYKCMPFLVDSQELSDQEENAISTAWYLNNERETIKEKEEYKKMMIKKGYLQLDEELVKTAIKQNKRLELKASMTSDWFSLNMDNIYKPIEHEGRYYLMKPRARTRGFLLEKFQNAFCKLV